MDNAASQQKRHRFSALPLDSCLPKEISPFTHSCAIFITKTLNVSSFSKYLTQSQNDFSSYIYASIVSIRNCIFGSPFGFALNPRGIGLSVRWSGFLDYSHAKFLSKGPRVHPLVSNLGNVARRYFTRWIERGKGGNGWKRAKDSKSLRNLRRFVISGASHGKIDVRRKRDSRWISDFFSSLLHFSFQISRETLYTPEVKKKKRNRIGKRFFGRASERKRKKRNRKRKRNKRRNKRGRGRSEVKYTSHGCKSAARCAFNFGFPRAENIRATFRAGIASRLTGIPTGTGVSYLIIVA